MVCGAQLRPDRQSRSLRRATGATRISTDPARPLGERAEGEIVLGPEEGIVIELDATHMTTV